MPLSTQKPKLKSSIESSLEEAWLATYGKYEPGRDGKKMAQDFAKTAAPKLTDAIYNFVKDIAIQITPSTLATSSGPVTGVILPTDIKIS